MSKHRRSPSRPTPPPARPARDALIWACFGCALVPVALAWSGARWEVALGVGGLILLLALGCAVALRLSGLTLPTVQRQEDDHSRE